MKTKTHATDKDTSHDADSTRPRSNASVTTASAIPSAMVQLQSAAGNQAIQRLLRTGTMHQADGVADQVMRMQVLAVGHSGEFTPTSNPLVQRQVEVEEDEEELQLKTESGAVLQRQEIEEEEEEEEEDVLQGKFTTRQTPAQLEGDVGEATNRTGMPGRLKAGLEALSGMDLSGVRVHPNSTKPAQINALAYTQGQDIHVGPGQEKHLPHEGWHAVQQMQGRVKATIQAKGVSINDDTGLEREADVMGAKALQVTQAHQATTGPADLGSPPLRQKIETSGESTVQRRLIASGGEVDVFIAFAEPASGFDLEHDPATNELTAIASLVHPATSRQFARILLNIMNDASQDAEVLFGSHQGGVVVGGYPVAGSRVQRIDMDDIAALEAGAPGSGIAKLAHEIQENYTGHAGAPVGGMAPFGPAHVAGMAAESSVASELVGLGNRVAFVLDRHSPTSFTAILDFETYYLLYTLDRSLPADFELSNARQAAKQFIWTDTVDQFASGSSTLPAAAAASVAAAAANVAANADSTVRIQGYTDSKGKAADNITLSGSRATAIQGALVAAGVPRRRTYIVPLGETDFAASNSTRAGRARNRRVEIAVTRPDPTAGPMSSVP